MKPGRPRCHDDGPAPTKRGSSPRREPADGTRASADMQRTRSALIHLQGMRAQKSLESTGRIFAERTRHEAKGGVSNDRESGVGSITTAGRTGAGSRDSSMHQHVSAPRTLSALAPEGVKVRGVEGLGNGFLP